MIAIAASAGPRDSSAAVEIGTVLQWDPARLSSTSRTSLVTIAYRIRGRKKLRVQTGAGDARA